MIWARIVSRGPIKIECEKKARLMRLQNKGLKMDSQAKFQGLKYVKDIQRIQAEVASSRKHKLTHKVPLADERKLKKKAKRTQ
jgi:hypothetical protein